MGSIPASMAQLVIRIGRSRLAAPSTAAARADSPPRRRSSANVTSRIAFAIATPIAMMAPMNDWIFKFEPVNHKASSTPAMTAGAVETVASASRTD
jgi:hypothetical protein